MPVTDTGTLREDTATFPEIRVRGLVKRYRIGGRHVEALRGLDLDVDGSGFVAVMGASGSGKSTLLHLLAGLDRPDAGTIALQTGAGAINVEALTERELTLYRRRSVGVVFQQFNLLQTLTALENIVLPGVLDGRPRDELLARGQALLGELGLVDRSDHRPDALSGGEQQRVAIARALLFEPPVLLADEPTGNLDSNTSERLWDMLERVAAARSILVLMVTHEPVAAAHCRTVHVLRDGQLAGTFDVDGCTASELALRAAELARVDGRRSTR